MEKLRFLNLGSTQLTDAGLARLAEIMTKLETLDLTRTQVTDATLERLKDAFGT